ncbi:hypothetical protein [Microbacterium sp.]|uniref:hypothetical protein n=1 Tax=Microbacterium sp. TaxID=51671 RepID=UPI0028124DAB|nr:hypothetical protein [Microbacterium sp.]
MRPSGPAIAAAVVLAAEAAGILVVTVFELFALGSGDASSTPSGLALVALTLLGAVALAAFSWGTLRRASWARSGAIVFQVLGIALGLASLSIRPVPWLFALGVGGTALVGVVLLIAAVRRDGADDPRVRGSED